MKKVFFVDDFIGGVAPTSVNELAIFDPVNGVYIDYGESATAASREELVLQTYRTDNDGLNGQVISFPVYMNNKRVNNTALAVPAAQYLTITPTGTITSTKTYTLAVGVSGHGLDMPRYTKKYSVTGVATVAALIDAWVVQMNAGGTVTDIQGIAFVATDNTTNIVLTVTGAAYYDQTLIAWAEADLMDNLAASAIVSTPGTYGMTAVEIKALESAADTELGDHKFNYRTDQWFDLKSGYLAAANWLLAITTNKPTDDPLPRENNFTQELLLFYDHDAGVTGGDATDPVQVRDIIGWLLGTGTMPATVDADGGRVS